MNSVDLTQTELRLIAEAHKAFQVAEATAQATINTVTKLALSRYEGPAVAGWVLDIDKGQLIQVPDPPPPTA